jgi:HPt (histidine-containing phosphotransfer) domain-containing protein
VEGWGVAEPEKAQPGDGTVPVDVKGLRDELRAAGVEEIVTDLLGTFVRDAGGRVEALRAAAAANDLVALERAAHAYKSAAGTVRAQQLADLLKQVELAAKAQEQGAALALIPQVLEAHERALAYLQTNGGGG